MWGSIIRYKQANNVYSAEIKHRIECALRPGTYTGLLYFRTVDGVFSRIMMPGEAWYRERPDTDASRQAAASAADASTDR